AIVPGVGARAVTGASASTYHSGARAAPGATARPPDVDRAATAVTNSIHPKQPAGPLRQARGVPSIVKGNADMASAPAAPLTPPPVADQYARLEEKILERDQKGASRIYYDLVQADRPQPELLREIVRIHAPYTHVPYHQRLDDGVPRFVNNDHCLLSSRA